MLDNWLHPITDKALLRLVREQADGLGRQLLQSAADPEKLQIALISDGLPFSRLVRSYLYGLSAHSGDVAMADLGTLRKPDSDFAIPLLRELLESKIIPVLFVADPAFTGALVRAQALIHPHLNLGLFAASPQAQLSQDQLIGPLAPALGHTELSHFCLLGSQSHYLRPRFLKWLRARQYENLRLGAIRGNLPAAEPYIRDADLLGFHLNSLKQIEAPGQKPVSPSGFFSEEACQLVRYGGMSDKLRAMLFCGYEPATDKNEQTAGLLAQLIWYFLEGVANRKGDFPISKQNLVEYIVQNKEWNAPLVFWKSNKSGRWWLQLPRNTNAPGRHHLVPCSYEDYVACTRDELPDRLLVRLQREFG